MSLDTDLAILGAGPAGLEAALAAAERGLSFRVFESAPTVAGHIERWRHVRLFTPWSMNASARMRAVLAAAGRPVPDGGTCPTGGELIDALLAPLADLPSIRDHLSCGLRVDRVGRAGLLKHEAIGAPERADAPFRLLVRDVEGREQTVSAHTIIDATGNTTPNLLGDGGIPAPGEGAAASRIVHEIPDLERTGDDWLGLRVLLVGAGHSAQTAAREFAALVERTGDRAPVVSWAVRRAAPTWGAVSDDPLPQRAALARFASQLAGRDDDGPIRLLAGTVITAFTPAGDGVVVTLRRGDEIIDLPVDRVVALVGRVGDDRLYRQLQIHECYATSGPMKLAAALMGASGGGGDCLAQTSLGADALRNPEPGYFIVGSKSYGRRGDYLMRVGWEQIDEVFSLLASAAA